MNNDIKEINRIQKNLYFMIDRNVEKQVRIDKAINKLKDTNVDMPSTLLIEVIDYAVHILQGSDDEWNK